MSERPRIELRTSPHVRATDDVVAIMRNVVYALSPICAWSVWQYGLSALALLGTVTLTCLATEQFFAWMGCRTKAPTAHRQSPPRPGEPRSRASKHCPNPIADWSATITGLLLALTLPPGFPLWMGAVAGFSAIALGKAIFGGLGMNILNPALVGRAFVQAAFPVAITSWAPPLFEGRFTSFIPSTLAAPFMSPPAIGEWARGVGVDAFTGATPLGLQKFDGIVTPLADLLTGMTAGSAGETPAVLILLSGLYLAARHMLDWRIPAAVLAGTAITAGFFYLVDPNHYPDPLFMLFSGGLMLGAWFMATDMVGSPVTPLGVLVYGLLIGFLTVIIRLFGGLSEGVMYAILLGNAATPLIEQWTQPRVFGEKKIGG
jgi:electron transport complex protein RnfD